MKAGQLQPPEEDSILESTQAQKQQSVSFAEPRPGEGAAGPREPDQVANQEQQNNSTAMDSDLVGSHAAEEADTAMSTGPPADTSSNSRQLDLASLALPKLGSLRPIRTISVAPDSGAEVLQSQLSNLTYGLEPSVSRGRTGRPRLEASDSNSSTPAATTPRHRSRRNSMQAANSEGPWGSLLSGPSSRLSRGISLLQSQAGDETPRGGRSMSPKLRGVFAEFAVKVIALSHGRSLHIPKHVPIHACTYSEPWTTLHAVTLEMAWSV